MINATLAPIRFTIDSAASDNSPTEPVKKYAADFSTMVVSAAPIESHANRVKNDRSMSGLSM